MVYYYSVEEYRKYKEHSDRLKEAGKKGKAFEERFRSFCKEYEILVQKGNLFAAYMLQGSVLSRKIKKKSVRDELKELKKLVKDQKSILIALFSEYRSDNEDYGIKITGLPDFIIKTQEKLPVWVELKAGKSVPSGHQEYRRLELEEMGFKVFLLREEDDLLNLLNANYPDLISEKKSKILAEKNEKKNKSEKFVSVDTRRNLVPVNSVKSSGKKYSKRITIQDLFEDDEE